jgi:hypothetical protein
MGGYPDLHIDTWLEGARELLKTMYGKKHPTDDGFFGHMYNIWAPLEIEDITSAPLGVEVDKKVYYGFALTPGSGVVFRTDTIRHGALPFLELPLKPDNNIHQLPAAEVFNERNIRKSIDLRFWTIYKNDPTQKPLKRLFIP